MKELTCVSCGDLFTLRFGEREDEENCLACRGELSIDLDKPQSKLDDAFFPIMKNYL